MYILIIVIIMIIIVIVIIIMIVMRMSVCPSALGAAGRPPGVSSGVAIE